MVSRFISLFVALALLIADLSLAQGVMINEVMTLNVDAVADEDRDYPDWIELLNASNIQIDLTGYGLSDDPDEPLKWVLPSVILNPGEYMLVFASGKDQGLWADYIETIIWQDDTCRYWIGDSEPPANWKQSAFDDSGWQSGPSGFGFGDDDDATVIPQTLSIYIRKTFTLDNYHDVTGAILHMDYDDGFVAYLNNVEIARSNIGTPGIPPAHSDSADLNHEALLYAGLPPEIFIVEDPLSLLNPGLNVLAVQVHNSTSESSDLTVIPFFTLGFDAAPDNPRGIPDEIKQAMPKFHTNFSLRSNGESLTLADYSGSVIDSLGSIEIPANLSYGRTPDGGNSWLFFTEPTPGASNSDEGWEDITEKPAFSPEGGLFPGSINVSLIPPSPGTTVYYTLDSSDPDENSTEYAAMIRVDTTTVIKAIAYHPGEIPSQIEIQSYIIGYTTDLPVISLSTDPPNFWDEETGIYVLGPDYDPEPPNRGANFWQDWERPIHIEFFEPDGSLGFEADAGVKIHGGWTRFFPQKSLALYARAQYGDGSFDYQIFPDCDIDKFESIVLRNSGSDWDHTMFRDPMMVSLVEELGQDFQAYRPAITFLNGAYWGIYNIREKKNEHYIASHYDVDPDNVDIMDIWGNVNHGDAHHYNRMMDFLNNNDLSEQANYEHISTLMDINNFMTWNIIHIYIDNTDWPGNNNEFWRPHHPGGKWRWFLFDTDFGFGLHDSQAHLHNTMEYATNSEGEDWPNPAYSTFLFRKLLENEEFCERFINCIADMMNFNFDPEFVAARIDSMKAVIEPYIGLHLERWGRNIDEWNQRVDELYFFAEERPEPMRGFIQDYFGLSGSAEVTVDVSPAGYGSVQVVDRTIPVYPWSGVYFKDVPITFTAVPVDSGTFRFVGWSGASNSTDRTILLTLDGDTELTAVFERRIFINDGIVINEINYNSSPDFDTEDWIELHSITGDHDLSFYILRDGGTQQFILPSGTMLREGEYLTVVRDSVDFLRFFPNAVNLTGCFDFGFNNAGDQVRLYDPTGELVDSVAYDDVDPWPVEADGSGATLELIAPSLPNENPENWRASVMPHGSPELSNTYHAPSSFTLAYPTNGSVMYDDTVTVGWSTSVDPDTGDVITYYVEWSLVSDFNPSMQEAVTDTFFQICDAPSIVETLASNRSLRPVTGSQVILENRHCEEIPTSRDDKAISNVLMNNETAPLRSQRRVYSLHSRSINHHSVDKTSSLSEGKLNTDGLPNGSTVFWRVRAVDNRGLEVIAEPPGELGWLFVLDVPMNHPPESFELAYPPDGSVMEDDSVMVKWTVSSDPDDGDEVTYMVEWSLTPDFQTILQETTTDTFLLLTDAPPNGTESISIGGFDKTGYIDHLDRWSGTDALPDSQSVYWRVRAVDTDGLETAGYPGLTGWRFDILFPYIEPPELPESFQVGNAYPNPFNSRFTLPLELSEAGEYEVIIYNLSGSVVYRENLELGIGYHDFLFDDNGMEFRLATGMFFLQVKYEGKSYAQKVMLLR